MRKSRFYQISGNFRSGVLSPAAQDDITREDWLNGAAELTNFDVLRDGGIRTRPRLVRPADTDPQMHLPVLRRSALGPVVPAAPWHFSNSRALQQDGAHPIDLDGSPFLTIGLTRDDARGTAVRSITLRGVRLRQGPWRVGTGTASPTLVFSMEVSRDGMWTAVDQRTVDGGNPYHRFAFAPGRVRRDIVVQIPREAGSAFRQLDRVRFRVKVDPASEQGRELALRTLELRIDNIEVWDARGAGPPLAVSAYRILPWTLREFDLGLILAQEQMMVVGAPRAQRVWVPELVVPRQNAWSFTARQLQELTWCAYGSHLLLFHDEFPRPLEVRLSGTGQLSIDYLAMDHLPQLPARLAPEARLDVRQDADGRIVLDQPEAVVGAPTHAVEPTNVRGVARVGGLDVFWSNVGATRYKVYVQPETQYRTFTPETAWDTVTPVVVMVPRATLTGLVGGVEYRVAVASVVDAGPNALAGETDPVDADDLVLTVLEGALPAPTLRASASTSTDGAIDLSWGPVTGATGFRLEARAGQGPWANAAQQPAQGATALVFVGTPEVVYSFRLTATSETAPDSPPSNVVTVTAPRLLPGTPAGLTATRDAAVNGRMRLQWDAAARAQNYGLEISLNSGFTDIEVSPLPFSGRSYSITFPHSGGVYAQRWWRVRSRRITSTGPLESPWASGTFTPAWVPLVAVTNVRIATINGVQGISWDAVPGATSYQVRFALGAGTYGGPEDYSGLRRPFDLPGAANDVVAGFSYRVQVRAVQLAATPDNLGPWSAELVFTA